MGHAKSKPVFGIFNHGRQKLGYMTTKDGQGGWEPDFKKKRGRAIPVMKTKMLISSCSGPYRFDALLLHKYSCHTLLTAVY